MNRIPKEWSVEDPVVRERFVRALSKLGNVGAAAALLRLPTAAFYTRRRSDQAFADDWDAAILVARDTFEEELHRRVLEGIEDKIYRGGQAIGGTRRYSDRLGVYVHQVLERRAQKAEARLEAAEQRAHEAAQDFRTQDPIVILKDAMYLLEHALEKVRDGGHAGTRRAVDGMLRHLPGILSIHTGAPPAGQ